MPVNCCVAWPRFGVCAAGAALPLRSSAADRIAKSDRVLRRILFDSEWRLHRIRSIGPRWRRRRDVATRLAALVAFDVRCGDHSYRVLRLASAGFGQEFSICPDASRHQPDMFSCRCCSTDRYLRICILADVENVDEDVDGSSVVGPLIAKFGKLRPVTN